MIISKKTQFLLIKKALLLIAESKPEKTLLINVFRHLPFYNVPRFIIVRFRLRLSWCIFFKNIIDK